MVNYLKDNGWAPNGVMTLEQVGKSYEFFSYMAALQSQIRQRSLALTFEPTEEVHKFALKLMTRIKEVQEETGDSTPVVATQLAPLTSPDGGNTCSVATVKDKPDITCKYCQKVGHRAGRCYIRVLERRKGWLQKGPVTLARCRVSASEQKNTC